MRGFQIINQFSLVIYQFTKIFQSPKYSMENNQTEQQPAVVTEQENVVQQSAEKEIVIVEGQLKKIIHKQGQGQCPKKGQQIFALYRGTLQNGTEFDSNQDRDSPFKFNLGEGRVIKGWDEGFATMKRGEKATLICSPDYAYGKRGSPPRIPPNSTLNFQVELLDFQDKIKEKWEMSDEQKVAEATTAKNQGNQAFKKGEYKEANRLYKKGIEVVEDDDNVEALEILKILRLNAAQSQIKAGQYTEAVNNCTKVLEKNANNLKALYRRGVAYLKSQDFQKAQIDFESLLKIDPTNTEAQKQLQNVKTTQKLYLQKQKKVFGNMFAKAGTYSEVQKKQEAPKTEQPEQKSEAQKKEE